MEKDSKLVVLGVLSAIYIGIIVFIPDSYHYKNTDIQLLFFKIGGYVFISLAILCGISKGLILAIKNKKGRGYLEINFEKMFEVALKVLVWSIILTGVINFTYQISPFIKDNVSMIVFIAGIYLIYRFFKKKKIELGF